MPTLSMTFSRSGSTASASQSPRVSTPGGSLFLSSPISPTGRDPLVVADIHDINHKKSEECPHAFHPPTESDSRGPCPALNTLANHGYLSRNGRNITRKQLLAALGNPETYHLSKPLAELLVHGGFFMMHKHTSSSLSLHELAEHNLIEHDASLVHKDTAPGQKFAPTRCDTKLLNELMDSGALTLEKVASRREELERIAPLDDLHQEVARGEWALVLDIFGREHGGKCRADMLRVWLKQNRFLEGWKPSHEQGLAATISEAGDIRNEMKKVKKDRENAAKGVTAQTPPGSLTSSLTCCGREGGFEC